MNKRVGATRLWTQWWRPSCHAEIIASAMGSGNAPTKIGGDPGRAGGKSRGGSRPDRTRGARSGPGVGEANYSSDSTTHARRESGPSVGVGRRNFTWNSAVTVQGGRPASARCMRWWAAAQLL